jgi:hypothetical protein
MTNDLIFIPSSFVHATLRLNTHCVKACWLKESNKEDEQSAPPSVCSFLLLS